MTLFGARVPAGVPTGGQFAASARPEATVGLTPERTAHEPPFWVDAEWFGRLAEHQQRDLAEDGTFTILDASGDPVEVVPGVIDDRADWAFKRGQCLALAVTLAKKTGGKVYCQRVDFDDTDEHGEKFYGLGHAYVLLPEGVLLDIQGEHGDVDDLPDLTDDMGIELDDDETIEPLIFDNPRDALDHFDGYLVDQDLVAAEPFAATVLAHYRLGTYTGEDDYDALGADDAKALIDPDLIRRYTLGDCGVLAHYLAERNGWGVCVVGDYEVEEWTGLDDDEPEYAVDRLQHAYAVRPDGALVDVLGVHDPQVAADLARDKRTSLHTYPDAASADKVWNHAQWMDEQVDFEDHYDEEGASGAELAEHTATLVTIAYGEGV